MKLRHTPQEAAHCSTKNSRRLGLSCLLSLPIISCAHAHKSVPGPIRLEANAAGTEQPRLGGFEAMFNAAKKENAHVDSELCTFRAARAAILLKATIAKSRRLDEDFGMPAASFSEELRRAASDLESMRNIGVVEQAIGRVGAGLERLRQEHASRTKSELDAILGRLAKIRRRPVFLRRLHAHEEKKLAKEAESRRSAMHGLEAEKGLKINAADMEAAGFLERSISELQAQASRLNKQLADLRVREIESVERAASEVMKRLEGPGRSPDESSRRAQALFELKALHMKLETLRSLE